MNVLPYFYYTSLEICLMSLWGDCLRTQLQKTNILGLLFGCLHAKSFLYDTMDCSPSGSSVHGILQTRILKWVAMPSFRESSQLRDQTHVS